jgi:hypothetical protein
MLLKRSAPFPPSPLFCYDKGLASAISVPCFWGKKQVVKIKRYALIVALAFLALSLKGCVYLRLLEVKFQLSDFEKNFRLEDKGGLDLIFLKPVLLKEDILYLARQGPTTVQESPKISIWQFYFQKKGEGKSRNEKEFDVPVDLFFEGEVLTMVKLPKRFIEILPRPFIVESFKAIGRGKVHTEGRHVSGTFPAEKEGDGIPIPRKTDFLRLLGKPTEERRSSHAFAMTYIYILKPSNPESSGNPPQAWASFEFIPRTHRLSKAEARFAGIKLSMTFGNPDSCPDTP